MLLSRGRCILGHDGSTQRAGCGGSEAADGAVGCRAARGRAASRPGSCRPSLSMCVRPHSTAQHSTVQCTTSSAAAAARNRQCHEAAQHAATCDGPGFASVMVHMCMHCIPHPLRGLVCLHGPVQLGGLLIVSLPGCWLRIRILGCLSLLSVTLFPTPSVLAAVPHASPAAAFSERFSVLRDEVKAISFDQAGSHVALGFSTGAVKVLEYPAMKVVREWRWAAGPAESGLGDGGGGGGC
jgi:hypothetical protein